MTFLRAITIAVLAALCIPLLQAQSDFKTVQLTFTTIDVPGAGYTVVWGINKTGDMVGNYGQDTNGDSHGFVHSGGTFTYFDYPGESVTVPRGINDSGLIVGYDGNNPVAGFLYDGTIFTTIQHGRDSATYSDGINNAGEVVGATGTIYTTKGFQMNGNRFKVLKVPGQYVYVSGSGVNNLGVVVGWTDSDGFMCRAGQCRIIAVPGAIQTEALGVNDGGVIVGWYAVSGGCTCAFASKNGKYISFSYPGADTYAGGINASGQIVGAYTFDYQTWHGFVTSPITAADFTDPQGVLSPVVVRRRPL